MIALWVALAGGSGAVARYVLDDAVSRRTRAKFPVATLLINVTGSFVLGVLAGAVLFHGSPGDIKTIGGTGFCGGYTTFSTASIETVRLAEQRRWSACLAYAGGSLLLSLLGAGGGLVIGAHL